MEIFEQDCTFEFDACEMQVDPAAVVRLSQRRVDQLLESYEDKDPQFALLKVRAGSVSKNGNHWPDKILHDVAEQVNKNEPVGYLGHIRPQDKGHVFPEPQTLWLGASVVTGDDGKPTLYVKGYNLPDSDARKHIKSGVIKTASWSGKAVGKVVNRVNMIEQFILESIDWARPGTNGMDARIVAVTSEMEGSEKEMDWATVTLDDIEKGNPALFTLLEQRVAAKNATVVQEMEDKIAKADEAVSVIDKLCEVLKIDKAGDALDRVADLMKKVDDLGLAEVKTSVNAILGKKFKNPATQKAVMRLINVSEMVDKDDDKIEKDINEMIDTDGDLKSIIDEMEEPRAPQGIRGHQSKDARAEKGKVGASGMVSTSTRKL